jgi:Cd2+/Zn2+-exporting ATPase
MHSSGATNSTQPPEANCLLHSVSAAFLQEPSLEAVTIDPLHQTISIATLGKVEDPQFADRIAAKMQEARQGNADQQCRLLDGQGDCYTCGVPLSPFERHGDYHRRDAKGTTIARVTCPTAPSFWRWRDIPWPKVVQRDVEFLEHAEAVDEWKPQLIAASLCGVFGLTAYFLGAGMPATVFYLSAYLAGSWFAAQEVWERLRKRTIDVHFLMLAVAVGSASIGAWGEGTTLLFLFSLSGDLEHYALGRTRKAIQSLFKEAPKVATLLDENGREHEIPVSQLRPGMRLLIKPGAQFPLTRRSSKGRPPAMNPT